MSSAIAFVADIDVSRLFFSSPTTSGGRKTVDLFADRARGAMPSNRVRFQAAADETKPLFAKYGLDKVREIDHDPTRRKLLTVVPDDVVKGFQVFDEAVVAFEHTRPLVSAIRSRPPSGGDWSAFVDAKVIASKIGRAAVRRCWRAAWWWGALTGAVRVACRAQFDGLFDDPRDAHAARRRGGVRGVVPRQLDGRAAAVCLPGGRRGARALLRHHRLSPAVGLCQEGERRA